MANGWETISSVMRLAQNEYEAFVKQFPCREIVRRRNFSRDTKVGSSVLQLIPYLLFTALYWLSARPEEIQVHP